MTTDAIIHYYRTRQVEMTDHSVLFEIVGADGERVATASSYEPLFDLEMALNLAMTEAVEKNPDVMINIEM